MTHPLQTFLIFPLNEATSKLMWYLPKTFQINLRFSYRFQFDGIPTFSEISVQGGMESKI